MPPSAATQVAEELEQQRELFWRDYASTIQRGLLLGLTVAERVETCINDGGIGRKTAFFKRSRFGKEK
ncbi:MAG: hypothetical protein R3C05_21305 [Pirellulaceae bacterium]